MSLADALGRRPVYKSWQKLPDPLESLQQDSPLHHSISNVTGLEPFLGVEVTTKIKDAIRADTCYQEVLEAVGKYTRKDILTLPAGHPAKELSSIWSLVSKAKARNEEDAFEVVLIDSSKLFVPVSQRHDLFNILHRPHQGINRTLSHAKRLFYWRGMREQISNLILSCKIYFKYQKSKSQIEEVEKTAPATHPMFRFHLDLFTWNSSQYSVGVDEYSGMMWLQKFSRTPRTDSLTAYLKGLFLEVGVPRYLRTDGGGQMRDKFEKWANDLGIEVDKSSPYNPISNSCSERHMQVCQEDPGPGQGREDPCKGGSLGPQVLSLLGGWCQPRKVVLWP